MRVIIATGLYNDAFGIPQHFRMLDSTTSPMSISRS